MALHTELEIYKAAYGLLGVATDYVKNMPRSIKPILGGRMNKLCIRLVLLIARANAARDKVPLINKLLATSQGERSEGEEPPDSRVSRGVKPLWSAATQGAPGQLNSMSTGVFAWD